jgi:hypothetical protein
MCFQARELKIVSLHSASAAMDSNDYATLALGVIGTATALLVAHTVWQWRRLSHIPGPFFASLSKWCMVKESLKGRQPNWFKDLNDQYGECRARPIYPELTVGQALLCALDRIN